MWLPCVIFIIMIRASCQEDLCSQQIITKLSTILDETLAKQDRSNEAIMGKFSEVTTRMTKMEATLIRVANELTSLKLTNENIEISAKAIQEDTLSNLEDIKNEMSDEFQDLNNRVGYFSEILNNTSELLQKSVCVPSCINGECISPNKCKCDPGWIGDQCEKAICDRGCINGECIAHNKCSCNPGWNGDQCDTAICEGGCFKGRCTGPNTCICNPGWNGDNCDKAICDRSCINGKCTALNTCTCIPGWTGDLCDEAICEHGCINGECTAPNKCTCDQGWSDGKCDKAICQPSCIRGNCTAPNTCFCETGWIGDQCGCHEAEGFFISPESKQCFKVFQGKKRSWTGALKMCKSKELELAKPNNAVALQKHLNEMYGSSQYWVGGQGTGSVFKWLRDGQELPNSSQLWYPGQPDDGVSENSCLFIYATDTALMNEPGKPYRDSLCSARIYPLCENIMG